MYLVVYYFSCTHIRFSPISFLSNILQPPLHGGQYCMEPVTPWLFFCSLCLWPPAFEASNYGRAILIPPICPFLAHLTQSKYRSCCPAFTEYISGRYSPSLSLHSWQASHNNPQSLHTKQLPTNNPSNSQHGKHHLPTRPIFLHSWQIPFPS